MEITSTTNHNFKPITLVITLDKQEEVEDLKELMSLTSFIVVEAWARKGLSVSAFAKKLITGLEGQLT